MSCSHNEPVNLKYSRRLAWSPEALWRRRSGGLEITVSRASARSLLAVEAPMLALLLLLFAVSATVSSRLDLDPLDWQLPRFITCPLFALTGIPCLMCGITRSFLAMGHLQLSQAFIFHPLGPFFYLALLALAAVLGLSLVSRRQLRAGFSARLWRRLIVSGSALLVAAWLVKLVVWHQAGLWDVPGF